MILADKIIRLRKKNGWSQEELADKMNVSRQAVSKWEGAQTVPDLEKLLRLSALFGVTTDYLLKDELEDEVYTDQEEAAGKRVTLREAHDYLAWRERASEQIALGTFLCILSVIPLLLLGAASDLLNVGIPENVAGGVGLVVMLVLVAAAVAIFLHCGAKNAPYAFLEQEPFETEYGVRGMVQERKRNYYPVYVRHNVFGACLCVLAPCALFCGVFMEQEFLIIVMLCVMLLLVGIGVVSFITAGVRWASMQKLLKEGEYTEEAKEKSRVKETVSLIYWLAVTAVYIVLLLVPGPWSRWSWVLWPVAGVLFGVAMAVCSLVLDKRK